MNYFGLFFTFMLPASSWGHWLYYPFVKWQQPA